MVISSSGTAPRSSFPEPLLPPAGGRRVGKTAVPTYREEAAMAHTATDITQAAADLIHAFNEADWDRYRTRFTSDVVYTETETGRRVDGAGACVELSQGWK